MIHPSYLIDGSDPLILDTSVLINLHACQYGQEVLAALPNDILVTEIVVGELQNETARTNGDQSFLYDLFASNMAIPVKLTDEEYDTFRGLTSGSQSVGDGEAATIAVATSRRVLPVIDERRARVQATRLCGRDAGWSIGILCHSQVVDVVGEQSAVEALYLALKNGRMRIPSESADHVISLIGLARALDCPCLPGYKLRFKQYLGGAGVSFAAADIRGQK